jgi:predicted ATP-grasp superfamily ATP-dependent carboligase
MFSIPGVIIIDGHVQGLSNTRSLGEKGIPVWICDKNRSVATYSKYCSGHSICPDYDSYNLVSHLIDLSKKQQLDGWLLFPSNDHAVHTISKYRNKLDQVFKIFTSQIELIELIQDKQKLLLFAKQHAIPIPELYELDFTSIESSVHLKFPLIVRGKDGLDFYKLFKQKIYRINNQQEFSEITNKISSKGLINRILIQELIPYNYKKTTISFCAFCSNGEVLTHWIGCKLGEHPIPFGTATSSKSIYNDEIKQLGIKLIENLNYTGVCEIEFLWNSSKNEYQLIEMNARTWLWVGLAKRCGVDFAFIAYQFVNDKNINYPKSYEKNVYWYNPITHISMILFLLLQGKFKLLTVFYIPLISKKENALFSWHDIKPGIMYFLNIFKFIKSR